MNAVDFLRRKVKAGRFAAQSAQAVALMTHACIRTEEQQPVVGRRFPQAQRLGTEQLL